MFEVAICLNNCVLGSDEKVMLGNAVELGAEDAEYRRATARIEVSFATSCG
jgi:hypothetical protein